jgi:gamma-polyglutamate biosynthesis protein CapC
MQLYLFSGIAISLLLTELTGFSPGGIVVAGYLSMFILQPKWIVGTLLVALLTYGLVELVKNHVLLYGRRLVVAYLLVGILFSQTASYLLLLYPMHNLGLSVIGYLIPGLIAKDFAKQGISVTVLWLSVAVVLTRLVVLVGEG